MTISMHQASAPVFLRQLQALSALLKKGAEFAEAKGMDPTELVEARLAPDMFPLARQVQIASDAAKACMARLAGREVPSYPDEEKTFDELIARVEKTVAFIQGIPAGEVDGSEERRFNLTLQGQQVEFVGQPFLLHMALPNFFFHTTMVYALLRKAGVELGKRDFLAM